MANSTGKAYALHTLSVIVVLIPGAASRTRTQSVKPPSAAHMRGVLPFCMSNIHTLFMHLIMPKVNKSK